MKNMPFEQYTTTKWSYFWEKNWTRFLLCQIVSEHHFQNLYFLILFLNLVQGSVVTLNVFLSLRRRGMSYLFFYIKKLRETKKTIFFFFGQVKNNLDYFEALKSKILISNFLFGKCFLCTSNLCSFLGSL